MPKKTITSLEELRAKRNEYMKAYRKRVEAADPSKAEKRREYMRNYSRKVRATAEYQATKNDRFVKSRIVYLINRGYVVTKDGKPVAPEGEGTAQ